MSSVRRLLYLIPDGFPTQRPDVSVLFGKELPRHGTFCDLVAQRSKDDHKTTVHWPAGKVWTCARVYSKPVNQLLAFWNDCRRLLAKGAERYDAIQVRDKVFAGLIGLFCAHQRGLPFFFWMSFPMSEGYIDFARLKGLSIGPLRWAFLMFKGHVGRFLLHKVLLPQCDHVFVQSERMAADLVRVGVRRDRMTAVPMGVDLEQIASCWPVSAPAASQLAGRRVIGYQGSLDRARRVDFLFEMLAEVRRKIPDACLLLIGDTCESSDREWLKARAAELGVDDAVMWTGWLSQSVAWSYLRHAEVAVSVVPRGAIFDCASPTKVVEYLALGLPVVANDQPDQKKVLTESRAGLSVTMDVGTFSAATVKILSDRALAKTMSAAGPPYVKAMRNYSLLGERVASVYDRLLKFGERRATRPVRSLERFYR